MLLQRANDLVLLQALLLVVLLVAVLLLAPPWRLLRVLPGLQRIG